MTEAKRYHDPREYARGLQQILVSDSKRLGFLFGAGTSMAIKPGASKDSQIPSVGEMTNIVMDKVQEPKFKIALAAVTTELRDEGTPVQIEYILSAIAQKERVVANETLCGLHREEFRLLRKAIEKEIIALVSVHKKSDSFIKDLIHCDFARWVSYARRKSPVEIFTLNYDYLFELGLEHLGVPYFDGFVGSYEPFFSSTLVEDASFYPKHSRLWKLHGSLGWHQCENTGQILRRGRDEGTIVAFPSILKYEDSRKQPFVSFLDRLEGFLREDDGVLFVCGYSFGDQHVNDVILRSLAADTTSHVIALCLDKRTTNGADEFLLSEGSALSLLGQRSSRLSIYGTRTAVIGGRFGTWRLRNEPAKDDSIVIDSYFDEDAAEPQDGAGENHDWTGTGELVLPDFAKFTDFLGSMSQD